MPKLTVGPYVASLKTGPAQVRDRSAFLARARLRDEVPSVAGASRWWAWAVRVASPPFCCRT
ncbi:hypothetical protein [Deinococcus arcticus]|uniref:hypothetical protein n=1 Tax=Deinococcus arcticus TaxID=2136176 RepID=UPI0018ED69A2|nr:hypothetical protein [Deinococcus arcticus]